MKERRTSCVDVPLETYVCRVCGAEVALGEGTVAITQCECGNHFKYRTNVADPCFDIPCVVCGSPCTVEFRADRGRYESAG